MVMLFEALFPADCKPSNCESGACPVSPLKYDDEVSFKDQYGRAVDLASAHQCTETVFTRVSYTLVSSALHRFHQRPNDPPVRLFAALLMFALNAVGLLIHKNI